MLYKSLVYFPVPVSFFLLLFKNIHLRVEFLLKTDSGYPKDTGVNKPWSVTPTTALQSSLLIRVPASRRNSRLFAHENFSQIYGQARILRFSVSHRHMSGAITQTKGIQG